MKTYIIDFGENANGGRYALVQARSREEAFWDADSIGLPARISELKIPKVEDGIRYIEISSVESPFAGRTLAESFKWRPATDWEEKSEKAVVFDE